MPTKQEQQEADAQRQAEANEAAAARAEQEAKIAERNTRDAFDVPVGAEDGEKTVEQQREEKVFEEWDLLASTILQRWPLIPAAHWNGRQGNYEELLDALVEFYKVDREEAARLAHVWLAQQYRAE